MEPSRYSATESLRDGRQVQIRALQPADREGLEAVVQRMSDESIYRRFFSLKRHFTDVRNIKPKASRQDSSEVFFVATGCKGR